MALPTVGPDVTVRGPTLVFASTGLPGRRADAWGLKRRGRAPALTLVVLYIVSPWGEWRSSFAPSSRLVLAFLVLPRCSQSTSVFPDWLPSKFLMAPKWSAPFTADDRGKRRKTMVTGTTFAKLPRSDITKEHLSSLVERGDGHAPGEEEVSSPNPVEVVVFEEQLVCDLRLPCSNFLESVLRHFRLEVQHIFPNSFVRLSTFQ